VKQAVLTGDVTQLRKIRGIGTKTAERMVLELRGPLGRVGLKAARAFVGVGETPVLDAISALVSLGFHRGKAEETVAVVRTRLGGEATVEELVREALKSA
jgi:Holliday junction DNA helicase RuvA